MPNIFRLFNEFLCSMGYHRFRKSRRSVYRYVCTRRWSGWIGCSAEEYRRV